MGFIKNALGMIGDAATGGLASGIGSFVSGILGDKGLSKKDQLEIMNKQHGYSKTWTIKPSSTKKWHKETNNAKMNTSE